MIFFFSAEIDRLLKKVSEGVDTFEAIFAKISHTQSNNQKEKYEQDLKKEIKKLQRLRDQIKTWLASNNVKDKRALLENRKLIESQMEQFKQIEREMKTKAYSREGLMQKERNPKDKEKAEASDFVTNAVDELSRQVETVEFEIEQLEGAGSKRGKRAAEKRVEKLEEMNRTNERRKFHIGRLELVLRLLENDQLEADNVNELKDAIQYYVECNQEPDFEEDEGLYDELNLEEEEEIYAIRATDEFHNKSESESEEGHEGEYSARGNVLNSNQSNNENVEPVKEEVDIKIQKETIPETTPLEQHDVTMPVISALPVDVSNSSQPKSSPKPKVVSAWVEPPKIVNSIKEQKFKEPAKLPAALSDLGPSFQAAKNRSFDIQYTNQMLDANLQYVPDLIDSEIPKIYHPKNPINTPAYYPQQPLAIFDNPALYEKFDIDTLFYIFYYQPGTYQQYLAARELRKQSWRFHKKYSTWFQRHEEPKTITEDYEQGIYIYYDYENAWCQRKKTDFRFDYCYLEDS
ncbi:unnamed protein product [Rhizopus stolonifer]